VLVVPVDRYCGARLRFGCSGPRAGPAPHARVETINCQQRQWNWRGKRTGYPAANCL